MIFTWVITTGWTSFTFQPTLEFIEECLDYKDHKHDYSKRSQTSSRVQEGTVLV